MCHIILPTPARLFRLQMPNTRSDLCILCDQNRIGDLMHCLLQCPYNDGAGNFLLNKLSVHIPNLLPQQVVHLDLNVDDQQLPLVFLTASVLSEIWICRKEKKPCHLISINILRKSRFKEAAETLVGLLDIH